MVPLVAMVHPSGHLVCQCGGLLRGYHIPGCAQCIGCGGLFYTSFPLFAVGEIYQGGRP